MNEPIREFVDSRGVAMRVDRQAGVIRGVKVLGLVSRNRRTYLPEALREAAGLYEGAKVNVNHPKGHAAAPRDYQDRIGLMRNVGLRDGEGLFADFHFNPKHALAEQLLWDAEHAPENVGFSHNVEARTARRDGRVVVEAITRVQSVDLVADPATSRGLFESRGDARGPGGGGGSAGSADALEEATVEGLRARRPDLVEAVLSEGLDELADLRAEVARLRAGQAADKRQTTIRRLLEEFGLPTPEDADPRARSIVGPAFLESLEAAPSDEAVRALIEERARLIRALGGQPSGHSHLPHRPESRAQHLVDAAAPLDAKSFAAAIT